MKQTNLHSLQQVFDFDSDLEIYTLEEIFFIACTTRQLYMGQNLYN